MKILAALDQSKHAPDVLKKAAELAKVQNADLIVLTVAEDFMDIGDYANEAEEITNKILKQTRQAGEQYVAEAKAMGVAAKIEVKQGVSPADLIVKLAEDEKVDLIVMGSRGKKGIARFLIGSVASKVVNHAPCSVLVVR